MVLVKVMADYKNGNKVSLESTIEPQCEGHLTAMQVATGFSVSIIAQMMAGGEIRRSGVLYQETDIPAEKYMNELSKRGIHFKRMETCSERQSAS